MKLGTASVVLFSLLQGCKARNDNALSSQPQGPPVPELINSNCKLNYDETYKAECESFCAEFFEVCVNPNYFSAQMSWDECIHSCTSWPRTKAKVTRPPEKFYHLGSNTFACRDLHLWEAQLFDSPVNAAFHCYHSVADGGNICADVEIDGKDPFETLRDSACTHHHYGYCDLSGGAIGHETVADCMKAGLSDSNLADALTMMPSTIEIIFMNENEGITELPSGIFANLINPLSLKALYFDDCNITTIAEDAFRPLVNLESLSLNLNKIEVLQDDLLKLPKLKGFSIFGDPTPPAGAVPEFGPGSGRKPGLLTSAGFNSTLFQHTPNLERMIMYGNSGITELPSGMFEGLSKLTTMFWVFCGLDENSFPDGLFEPLISMKYFDFQGNKFNELNPEWFDGGWTSNISRLVFFMNNIGPLGESFKGVFAAMPKLKQVLLHDNPISSIPADYFENNPELDQLTLGPA